MGRPRKSNPLNLPDRVYAKHGAFYFNHRPTEENPTGRWERIGTDVDQAKKRAGEIVGNLGDGFGKVPFWLDEFLVAMKLRVDVKDLAPRTLSDYTENAVMLKAWYRDYMPAGIEPKHVAAYLDKGLELDRAVRANREKACLSAMFTWLIRKGFAGMSSRPNPCLLVKRNKETKRDRYVEHEEMAAALERAPAQVWAVAHLVYRTLQRPEDIIQWTPRNLIERRGADGKMVRIIRNEQCKAITGGAPKIVDIEITPEIDRILARLKLPAKKRADGKPQSKVVTGLTLIHRRDGKPYSYDGLCAMLKRRQKQLRALHAAGNGSHAEMQSWGFYDMKGKGATDMWQSGVPLETIQVLCGHDSVTTTEKYVKARWRGIVAPNVVSLTG